MSAYVRAALAYIVPTFVIAVLWHMVVFDHYYRELAIYRQRLDVALGFATVVLQGAVFAYLLPRVLGSGSRWRQGLRFGGLAGLISWSYSTLAVAAKFPMTSVAGFLAIETAFTAVQFGVVGVLMAMAFGGGVEGDAGPE